jgi:small GTP-binding protein
MKGENKKLTKNTKAIPCKIILVGDSGVGKTSMITRYINNYNEKIAPTVSTSYFNKFEIIKDYVIKFQIWDTVGQEQYRSLNTLFYKDAHICLMVYDITNESSFSSIKDYWHPAIITNCLEGVIFGVAGNKNDLYEQEKVDKNEVRQFCDKINATFHYTSCKENKCIDEMFKELGEKFIDSNFMLEISSDYFSGRYNSFTIDGESEKNINNKKENKCC